ncbi:MAG: LysR substrate-binding domain-containing protein, partial [Kangiellaceae bacterium]|nr:LysR substrate-binding domain-containing protein [Kangiellaceae bacterium]
LADEAAQGINSEPIGHLCVTAPVMFGRMYVMPSIIEYLNVYPKATVQTVFLDRLVSLLEEGIDLGIRIGELPDSSMRAIRVGSVRQVVCASPEYLNRNGLPQTPDALESFQLISSNAGSFSHDWLFYKNNVASTIKIKSRLTVSNNESAIEAAVRGFGVVRLLSYQIAPQLKSNQLKIILEDYERPILPVHIVHREGRLSSTKIRAFIDLLASNLRKDPNLN